MINPLKQLNFANFRAFSLLGKAAIGFGIFAVLATAVILYTRNSIFNSFTEQLKHITHRESTPREKCIALIPSNFRNTDTFQNTVAVINALPEDKISHLLQLSPFFTNPALDEVERLITFCTYVGNLTEPTLLKQTIQIQAPQQGEEVNVFDVILIVGSMAQAMASQLRSYKDNRTIPPVFQDNPVLCDYLRSDAVHNMLNNKFDTLLANSNTLRTMNQNRALQH